MFFALAVMFYIASGVTGLVGAYSIANMFNLAMGISLLTLVMWAYVRYSGELREIGMQIDDMASFIWENVSHCYITITCDPLIMKLKLK